MMVFGVKYLSVWGSFDISVCWTITWRRSLLSWVISPSCLRWTWLPTSCLGCLSSCTSVESWPSSTWPETSWPASQRSVFTDLILNFWGCANVLVSHLNTENSFLFQQCLILIFLMSLRELGLWKDSRFSMWLGTSCPCSLSRYNV